MAGRKIKKAGSSLTGVVIILLMVIGIFTGCFLWLDKNASEASVTLDSKYNDTYGRLQSASSDIEDNVDEIRTNANKIEEADTTFQQAWNGLKTLGSTLKTPIIFVSSTEQVYEAILLNLDITPAWAKALFMIGLVAFVILLVLAILKGEPKL